MIWSFLLRGSAAYLLLATTPAAMASDLHHGEAGGNWFEGGFDLAEMQIGKGSDSLTWEGAVSYGNADNRIVAEFEGAGEFADVPSVESMAYLSDKSEVTGEVEVGIAQPSMHWLVANARAELGWSARPIPVEATGAGLTEAEFSLRLRYELTERLQPYIGVIHGRLLGDMVDIARNISEQCTATDFVVSVTFFFGGPPN